jgi:hypothetical protein
MMAADLPVCLFRGDSSTTVACSATKRFNALIDTGSLNSPALQDDSQGAKQVRPQTEANGIFSRITAKASLNFPSAISRM